MKPLCSLVPMLFVQSVPRSVEFYGKLGFEVGNTFTPPEESEPVWAWLKSGGAHVMFARATHPIVADQQGLIMYVYCDDVASFHAALGAAGVEVGEINYPFYSPRGEFRVKDPDGYDIEISHTSSGDPTDSY
jgi:catechol 2,3-dioxygenase-like lactoylglutathione lyase family enzyme